LNVEFAYKKVTPKKRHTFPIAYMVIW